jgi:hypothetical protein
LAAFLERWYRETSSFHLPEGEMIVILDDVAVILRLPVERAFFTRIPYSSDDAKKVLVGDWV